MSKKDLPLVDEHGEPLSPLQRLAASMEMEDDNSSTTPNLIPHTAPAQASSRQKPSVEKVASVSKKLELGGGADSDSVVAQSSVDGLTSSRSDGGTGFASSHVLLPPALCSGNRSSSPTTIPETEAHRMTTSQDDPQQDGATASPSASPNATTPSRHRNFCSAEEAYLHRLSQSSSKRRIDNSLEKDDAHRSGLVSPDRSEVSLPYLVSEGVELDEPRAWHCGSCGEVSCGRFCHNCGNQPVILKKFTEVISE